MRDYTEAANQYAEENDRLEPDFLRKQTIKDFIAGAKCAEEANPKDTYFVIASTESGNRKCYWGGSTEPKFGSFTSVKLYKTETLARKTLEDRKKMMVDPRWRNAYIQEVEITLGKNL